MYVSRSASRSISSIHISSRTARKDEVRPHFHISISDGRTSSGSPVWC